MMGASSCLGVEGTGGRVGGGSRHQPWGPHGTREPQGRNSVLALIRNSNLPYNCRALVWRESPNQVKNWEDPKNLSQS